MANQPDTPKLQPKPSPIVVAGVKYRKEVILLASVLIAFGIYALKVMNKNEFPDFTIREGVVGAIYPGATVEQIEEEVLKPLEDYIFSYKEVDKAKTHSQIRRVRSSCSWGLTITLRIPMRSGMNSR